MSALSYQQQWFGNPGRDIVAGAVVALALIPEAIAFSLIAGVDPQVGIYASFCIAVVIAFVGARPCMISAATSGTEFNPSLGLAWSATPALTLRAAAYQAFRLPTLNEYYRPFRVGDIVT